MKAEHACLVWVFIKQGFKMIQEIISPFSQIGLMQTQLLIVGPKSLLFHLTKLSSFHLRDIAHLCPSLFHSPLKYWLMTSSPLDWWLREPSLWSSLIYTNYDTYRPPRFTTHFEFTSPPPPNSSTNFLFSSTSRSNSSSSSSPIVTSVIQPARPLWPHPHRPTCHLLSTESNLLTPVAACPSLHLLNSLQSGT